MGKNDRSRQKGGLVGAMPNSQQEKSVGGVGSMNMQGYQNRTDIGAANLYLINKTLNQYKN